MSPSEGPKATDNMGAIADQGIKRANRYPLYRLDTLGALRVIIRDDDRNLPGFVCDIVTFISPPPQNTAGEKDIDLRNSLIAAVGRTQAEIFQAYKPLLPHITKNSNVIQVNRGSFCHKVFAPFFEGASVKSYPAPSITYCYGFRLFKSRKIKVPTLGKFRLPFLIVEVRDQALAGSSLHSTREAAVFGFICNSTIRQLHRRLLQKTVSRDIQLPQPITFICMLNATAAHLYVSWRRAFKGGLAKYPLQNLKRFRLDSLLDRLSLQKYLKQIIDWATNGPLSLFQNLFDAGAKASKVADWPRARGQQGQGKAGNGDELVGS